MKKIYKTLINYFYPISSIEDPIEKVFFYYDVNTTNLTRIIIFSYVLLCGLILIFIFDIIRYLNNSLLDFEKELAITHIVFIFLCIINIIVSKISFRKVKNHQTFRIIVFTICLFLFGMFIWTSLIDQKANGQVTVLIMGFFGISALLYLFPIDSLILFASSTTLFLLLLPYFQSNKFIVISHFINIPILTLISFFISVVFFNNKVNDFIKSKKIEKATTELDDLIQKILPTQIAYKLRKENKIEPIYRENATIVFIDFVSFSSVMEKIKVDIILQTLDNLFGYFDSIIKKYSLEKIKTIGDSYMFAGGLFSSDSQLKQCVEASLEIIELLESKQEYLVIQTGYEWRIRIGIDKGPVFCGIIGDWKFLFDVWGNTVNIAARLESLSQPNKINVSRNVYDELRFYNDFYFEPRGKIPIKNMEPVEMFFLDRIKNRLSK